MALTTYNAAVPKGPTFSFLNYYPGLGDAAGSMQRVVTTDAFGITPTRACVGMMKPRAPPTLRPARLPGEDY